ncbi:MAG TPA: hypothetical protein VFZ84_11510, partial [Burkholderiales bacterium]
LTRINIRARAGVMMLWMFNSPLEWCSLCRNWVALDQSFEEHARECGCDCKRGACPLAAFFRPGFEGAPDPRFRHRSAEA